MVIVVHQLPDLLGIPSGGHTTIGRLQHVFSNLSSTSAWTLAIGVGVFTTVIVVERLPIDECAPAGSAVAPAALRPGWWPRPTFMSHGVAVLGYVSHAAPAFGVHGLSWKALGELAPVAGTVALVIVTQSAASTRRRSRGRASTRLTSRPGSAGGRSGQRVIAGVSRAFPVNASPPRTAAVAHAGGRTQLSGVIAALALIALVPAAGVLKDVPLATLAGVLLYVASRIFRARELISIARFDAFEFGLAVVTLLTVALLGVRAGHRRRHRARDPRPDADQRSPAAPRRSDGSRARPAGPRSAPVGAAPQAPGAVVVLFATPLWYAGNAVRFQGGAA